MKYLLSLMLFLGVLSCTTSQVSKYKSIEYIAGPCFGFCPIYKITINPDNTAILEAEHYNFTTPEERGTLDLPREGTFKAKISADDYKKLITLVDAANIKSLKDSYIDKRIMDASKNTLTINFSDATAKKIQISAGDIPKELTAVYTFIEEIKQKQDWKKVE